MQQNLIILGLKNLTKSLILATFVTFSILSPIANAQGTTEAGGGVAGFSDCSFQGVDQSNSNEVIQKCISQILRFAFIVGIFVALFRIAFVAFNSSNPFFGGGGTTADMVKALRGFAIGAFILGSPVIILNTINPTLLNLDILGGVLNLTSGGNNGGSNNGAGGGTGGTSSTISSSTARAGGKSPSDLQKAINDFTADPSNTAAQNQIKDILAIEKNCQQTFVVDFSSCSALQDPGFKEAVTNIPQSARETIGSNLEAPRSFTAPVKATENFTIESGVANPTPDGCTKYGIRYTIDNGTPTNGASVTDRTLVVKKCNNQTSELFKRGPNGTLEVNDRAFKAGETITENIVDII